MKTKFLIPLLAMIIAIGMSFTTENPEQSFDYIHLGDDNWREISEQTCEGDEFTCRVQLGVGGPIYEVYDEEDLGTLKRSSSEDPTVIPMN